MEAHHKKENPWFFFITIIVFVALLFNACTFPILNLVHPKTTATPDIKKVSPVTETVIFAQEGAYSACYFNWTREVLPELSKEFETALKGIHPQAKGYAEAYGEDCINQDGDVVYFVAMETDFYVTFQVEDLEDKQALGNLAKQVLGVLTNFPVEETPGPQPGYVGITFETPDEALRLWFTQIEAESAIENGVGGKELFDTLQSR